MEAAIESQVLKFVDFIEGRYLSTGQEYRPMELSEKIQFFALDVIGELAFGEAFGYMRDNTDVHEYLKMLNSTVPLMLIQANLPWMAKVLQSPVFRTLFPKEGDKLGFGAFIGYNILPYSTYAFTLIDWVCQGRKKDCFPTIRPPGNSPA